MLNKLISFFTKRKRTIPEQSLVYTRNRLKHLLYNEGKILDVEINERLVELEKKIEYLIDKDYHIQILDELNGVLLALLESSIHKNKILSGSVNKIKKALDQYENFIDDMIKKYEEEENKEIEMTEKVINEELDKFSTIVKSMNDDIKKGKGSI
ncbi:hypothetical protein [Clostridium ganghwense]|uniref:Uncharacterized protein n=1 Tax=Clostridium ganghwense TaxID=312089 RepID=A0ABT4CNU3_9CLOT|nr:hypothetical protein [Clostridium ganghwense]MCY6370123.1 hypothetical protein [Clostridium ganghwense]